jgi:NADH-quinone oxidoreductase subunit G
VRFYKDYAGGTDLGVFGANDNVYFGRVEDGVLESEFSGNLTEVCPTGVFTDKTHSERYNRKWDMQYAPSICQSCSAGCNISPGERHGEVRRIENRFNGAVNHYFLCDRGRFGYGFANRKDRPRQPLLGTDVLGVDQALDKAAALLRGKRLIGIGSPRASLESNHALQVLVGADNFSCGIPAAELENLQLIRQLMERGPLPVASMRDIEAHDAVFILGEDLTQTAPRLALSVRQAARGKATEIAASMKIQDWHQAAVQNVAQDALYPIFIACPNKTRLDDIAKESVHAAPADLARIGFAVAHAIDPSAPAVAGLEADAQALAERIGQALLAARRPLLIGGASLDSQAIIEALGNVAQALNNRDKAGSISLVVPEANSLGVALLGGQPLDAALDALTEGRAEALVVLENDLFRRLPRARVDAALQACQALIAVDHQRTETVERAQLVLSAATFAEADGTLVSQEGRAQRFFQVFEPSYYDPDSRIRESWRWLHALNNTLREQPVDWTQLDQATADCAAAHPALAAIVDAAPKASFRIKGLKLAREPHRYSGRTALRANISVHEPRQPQDQDSAFAFSMEGYAGSAEPRQQVPFAWSPGWNSPQAWNKFQDEVGGHLRAGDPGVRLLDAPRQAINWFAVPSAFTPSATGLSVVPLYHLYGSDELSARAEPVQTRIEAPYALLAPEDAERLGIQESGLVILNLDGEAVCVTARISEACAPGVIELPRNLPGMPVFRAAGIVTVEAAQ